MEELSQNVRACGVRNVSFSSTANLRSRNQIPEKTYENVPTLHYKDCKKVNSRGCRILNKPDTECDFKYFFRDYEGDMREIRHNYTFPRGTVNSRTFTSYFENSPDILEDRLIGCRQSVPEFIAEAARMYKVVVGPLREQDSAGFSSQSVYQTETDSD